ncbi:2,3-diaminopropionate biosynthesis protein SbnB [Plantactinospora endophytica]|uniref:2,3-diaminopropionate biosynthesis protein SbnB n=1 Tax=Plantactinospora endophytica TaxID=673535 RepID=A0ABQ4EC29_9ACTN|nr:2,3-diaminopropionate biosynthesis protein SbnB [Plantactinospora endophytica]GIG92291.1 2,3-diaminopropionate biosynthesis protein SbnB [Plantactinospora endophytica]
MAAPSFAVVSGAQVQRALAGDPAAVLDVVADAYRLHGSGRTVNPPSYFLRFPDRPSARIIALPASVGGDGAVDGIKWISSFPENVATGLPRASAVLVLNDPATGYPFACLESSIISATRTAASAALAADRLTRGWAAQGRPRPARVGFVGAGLIARYVHTYLAGTGWQFDEVGIHDLDPDHARQWRDYLTGSGYTGPVTLHDDADSLIRASDLVVFATVAPAPHVHDPDLFGHAPLVLHLSLRDLSPEIILASTNVVDDVDHCLTAATSPHLAEQAVGHRDFVHATLYDVLTGDFRPPVDRPLVFSPFGLGVLDLAVGRYVHDRAAAAGDLTAIDDFFHELGRYGNRGAPCR